MKETYLGLLKDKWTMEEIDNMDIMYYLELLSYEANKGCRKNLEAVLNLL